MKSIRVFFVFFFFVGVGVGLSENVQYLEVKFSWYLNRRVFVMMSSVEILTQHAKR